MFGFTIADQLALNARSFPDRTAVQVVGGSQALSYAEVWRRTLAIAEALGRVEAGPHGPVAAILLPNGADHVLAYPACHVAGAASLPVNNRLAQPEVEFILKDSGAGVLLSGGELLPLARAAAATLGVRVVDIADVGDAAATPGYEIGVTGVRGDQTSSIVYTSGTTGFPKGAMVPMESQFIQFFRWGWQFGLTQDQVMLVGGPVFHMSFGGLALAALLVGSRVRIMPSFDGEQACDELARESTWAFLVPAMTTMVVDAWKRRGRPPLGALRFMLSSGASVPSALLAEAMEAFPNARIAEAYGWTEGGWVTFEVKDRATLRPHSVGWPVIGAEVVIRDAEGRPVPVGEPGEITVRSALPFAGYLNRPEANEVIRREGFVRSGDVGILDPDGRIRVVDRKNDMIVSGGENVYSAEVERVLLDHPDVAEAAVVGRPHELWGELVVAAVVTANPELTADEVRSFCRQQLAGYKVPKEVVFLDALPRNPMGKVQKFRLRELVAS